MNDPTKNIPQSLIQEIGDEITRLRKENAAYKLSRNPIINKQNLEIKLYKFCKDKCNILCKSKEKETKENCIIKNFIDDIGK